MDIPLIADHQIRQVTGIGDKGDVGVAAGKGVGIGRIIDAAARRGADIIGAGGSSSPFGTPNA